MTGRGSEAEGPAGLRDAAVDVGNSGLHLSLGPFSRVGGEPVSRRFDPDDATSAAEMMAGRVDRVAVASVSTPIRDRFVAAVAKVAAGINVVDVTRHHLPTRVDVDDPDAVGIDRLVAGFGAWTLAGRRPVMVVDSGSAVTADFVDREGTFRGGVIFPGLTMQSRALAGGTDRLFEVGFDAADPPLPARNTADAIAAGILTTATAGLERIRQRYVELAGDEGLTVVVTGGDAARIAAGLRCDRQRMLSAPDLVTTTLLELVEAIPAVSP